MERRENGLVEIFARLYNARNTLGLKFCKRMPTKPVQPNVDTVPGIYMVEGEDSVSERNSRNPFGYPARRNLEVVLEIIAPLDSDIKALYRAVRKTVLGGSVNVADDSFIRESRTEGPAGYEVPDLQGMRMVLVLTYVDTGD